MDDRLMSRGMRNALVVLFTLSVILGGMIVIHSLHDLDLAESHFKEQHRSRSRRAAADVERVFVEMYRTLRTISRLPRVRDIDRHATSFSADARLATQELCNNAYDRIGLSEVYIVPEDLDPDAIDPATGKPQEPILAFDQFIGGRHGGTPAIAVAEIEEIDIHEYQLMQRQLEWFHDHAPAIRVTTGFDVPAICGPEIVTCDNSRYDVARPDDHDRMGLVYSVPFYGADDELKGCVSGVILTDVIRDLLPGTGYALSNRGHHLSSREIEPRNRATSRSPASQTPICFSPTSSTSRFATAAASGNSGSGSRTTRTCCNPTSSLGNGARVRRPCPSSCSW